MTRVDFYHLQKWPLDQALPKLLEKVLAAGHRALVVASSVERVESLSAHLWAYDPDAWLPHGTERDGEAERQPVWLSADGINLNRADILVLTDGADVADKAGYVRCLDLFDGNDAEALASARSRWKACKDAGFSLHYWQQTETGGWAEKIL